MIWHTTLTGTFMTYVSKKQLKVAIMCTDCMVYVIYFNIRQHCYLLHYLLPISHEGTSPFSLFFKDTYTLFRSSIFDVAIKKYVLIFLFHSLPATNKFKEKMIYHIFLLNAECALLTHLTSCCSVLKSITLT